MVRYEYFVAIIPVFSTFSEKKLHKMAFIIFAPKNIKKPASKVAHNPTRPRVLTPASIEIQIGILLCPISFAYEYLQI